MTLNGMLQLALYVVVLIALAKPLGTYMAAVYETARLRSRDASVVPSNASCIARAASIRRARCAGPSTRSR